MDRLNNQGVELMARGEWDLAIDAFSRCLQMARRQCETTGRAMVAGDTSMGSWAELQGCLAPMRQSIEKVWDSTSDRPVSGMRFHGGSLSDLNLPSAVAVYNLASCIHLKALESPTLRDDTLLDKAKALYMHACTLSKQLVNEQECERCRVRVTLLSILRLATWYNLGLLHDHDQAAQTKIQGRMWMLAWQMARHMPDLEGQGGSCQEIHLFFLLYAMAVLDKGKSLAPAA